MIPSVTTLLLSSSTVITVADCYFIILMIRLCNAVFHQTAITVRGSLLEQPDQKRSTEVSACRVISLWPEIISRNSLKPVAMMSLLTRHSGNWPTVHCLQSY